MRYSLLLAAAALAAMPAGAVLSHPGSVSPQSAEISRSVDTSMSQFRSFMPSITQTRSDDEEDEPKLYCVTLDVDFDRDEPEELSGLWAMDATGADTSYKYGSAADEDDDYCTVYNFYLTEGTYDFFVSSTLGNFEGTAFITLDDVEVSSDMTFKLSTSSATHRTNIRHALPNGEELKLGKGAPAAYLIPILSHADTQMSVGSYLTDSEAMTYFVCNNPDSRFRFTRMDVMASPFGGLSMIIPVDFSKEWNGPDANTTAEWRSASQEFQPTPANIRYEAFKTANGGEDGYGFTSTMLMNAGKQIAYAGVGYYDEKCPCNVVASWQPEAYDGPYEMIPFCMGSIIGGYTSCISGLPMRRTDTGMRQVGGNFITNYWGYLCGEDSPVVGPEYELYATEPDGTPLGNCAPLLVICPDEEYFGFSYTGRHGECMNIDSNVYFIPTLEYWEEAIGGQQSEIEFRLGDEVLCEDILDFPYDCDWGEGGEYTLTISTANVLIDGETAGSTVAVNKFDTEQGPEMPPTLTSLSIVDARGIINDRLTDAEGAELVFTGGKFSYEDNWAMRYVYYPFSEVECESVAVTPYPAADDAEWQLLSAVKADEPVLPGYGSKFTTDLSALKNDAYKGWYTLRITITDNEGGSQTQTISPAFNVGTTTAVDSLNAGTIDVNGEIYTLDGMRVANFTDAPAGLYIVRGNQGVKKIFKK